MKPQYYVKKGALFPLADRYPLGRPSSTSHQPQYRAQYTGEYRPPRKGEWYLSGSPVEAYRAPNDLSQPFHIARIVEVKVVQTEKIVSRDPSRSGGSNPLPYLNVRFRDKYGEEGGRASLDPSDPSVNRRVLRLLKDLKEMRELEPGHDWHLETMGEQAGWHRWNDFSGFGIEASHMAREMGFQRRSNPAKQPYHYRRIYSLSPLAKRMLAESEAGQKRRLKMARRKRRRRNPELLLVGNPLRIPGARMYSRRRRRRRNYPLTVKYRGRRHPFRRLVKLAGGARRAAILFRRGQKYHGTKRIFTSLEMTKTRRRGMAGRRRRLVRRVQRRFKRRGGYWMKGLRKAWAMRRRKAANPRRRRR